MKKWILSIVAIVIIVFAVRAFAETEIEKINVDFANQDAMLYLESGNFVVNNSVLTNGDTVQTNSFVPNGGYTSAEIKQPAFAQIFGGLIQAGAVNMSMVANETIGNPNVYIAQTDTTTNDLGNVSH